MITVSHDPIDVDIALRQQGRCLSGLLGSAAPVGIGQTPAGTPRQRGSAGGAIIIPAIAPATTPSSNNVTLDPSAHRHEREVRGSAPAAAGSPAEPGWTSRRSELAVVKSADLFRGVVGWRRCLPRRLPMRV